jgi:flagellar M-ring protein FliF
MLQFTKDDVMYFVELGVMMLLGLVVLFMVIRPLVRRILASDDVAAAISGVLAGSGAADEAVPVGGQQLLPASAIDVATIQGQVHAQSIHRVGELAERNPNETVAIIRQWLAEPAK